MDPHFFISFTASYDLSSHFSKVTVSFSHTGNSLWLFTCYLPLSQPTVNFQTLT